MLVIVRHGNTFEAGETPRRIGARTDIGLTDQGVEQGRALGRMFADKGWSFGRVLTSPLLRTRQTAAAILAAQDSTFTPKTADFLCEIDHGPDENRTDPEILARIGADALAAWDARAELPNGWRVDPAARVAGWQALFAQCLAARAPTLAVTSNGAARFALMAEPRLQEAAKALATLKLPTGGYGIITADADGAPIVSVWGERP